MRYEVFKKNDDGSRVKIGEGETVTASKIEVNRDFKLPREYSLPNNENNKHLYSLLEKYVGSKVRMESEQIPTGLFNVSIEDNEIYLREVLQ